MKLFGLHSVSTTPEYSEVQDLSWADRLRLTLSFGTFPYNSIQGQLHPLDSMYELRFT
jgi:hypothetical protein